MTSAVRSRRSSKSIKRTSNPAILLVEQDVKLAARCADFALLLRRGRVIKRLAISELSDREGLRAAYIGRSADPMRVVAGNGPTGPEEPSGYRQR